MKVLKKSAAAVLAVVMAVGMGVTASAMETDLVFPSDRYDEVSSDYISVYTTDSGFGILDSNGRRVTSTNDWISSGNTYKVGAAMCGVNIDGVEHNDGYYDFYYSNPYTSPTFIVDQENKTITVNYICNKDEKNIAVERKLSIVNGKTSGKPDTMKIEYTLTNNDTEKHDLGVRFNLPFYRDDKTKFYFIMPNGDLINYAKQFEGNEIPGLIKGVEDLSEPKSALAAWFDEGKKPDILQFNNSGFFGGLYPKLTENIGVCEALAIWNPITFEPGDSKTYVMYGGLAEVESELSLKAEQDGNRFAVNEAGTGYEPMPILSELQNVSEFNVSKPTISLTLPEGVTTSDGETSVTYDAMNRGESKQAEWQLIAEPSDTERTVEVVVNADFYEEVNVAPVTLTYTIPAIGAEESSEESVEESSEVSEEESTEESAAEESSEDEADVEGIEEESEESEEAEEDSYVESEKETEDESDNEESAEASGSETAVSKSPAVVQKTTGNTDTIQTGSEFPFALIFAALGSAVLAAGLLLRKKHN